MRAVVSSPMLADAAPSDYPPRAGQASVTEGRAPHAEHIPLAECDADTVADLAMLTRRSTYSPRNFESLRNTETRSHQKRARKATIAREAKRGRAHRRGRRHANAGDDSTRNTGMDVRLQALGSPVRTTRFVALVNMPGRSSRNPIYVNDDAGLRSALGLLRRALAESGDSIVCLDAEWGCGRGSQPRARKRAWQWPSLVQVAARWERAVLVDLVALVGDKRELDPGICSCAVVRLTGRRRT